jgi:hypothetical protein
LSAPPHMFDFRESYVLQRFELRFPVGGPSAAREVSSISALEMSAP